MKFITCDSGLKGMRKESFLFSSLRFVLQMVKYSKTPAALKHRIVCISGLQNQPFAFLFSSYGFVKNKLDLDNHGGIKHI